MEPKSIDRLFWDAAQIGSPGERNAYLDRACADDAGLRRRVEQLLQARSRAADFLESPAPALAAAASEAISERPGTVVGPYRLMEQIGEGGFGLVFVAEQQHPVRRKVALKVIKPGMDTREVIARFEAERQALALMDHPNIATVLDAGATDSGRPYFVMELVKGIPITEFCDHYRLTPRERLGLFVNVCQTVQHAHQKGVIHRDVKPSNVLVTSHDGVPVVKVIDFGVAKAVGRQLTEKTVYTGFAQMLGTPLYMSPEQAEMSGLDLDTRADIYALGVLLYELLTGTTPFESARLRQANFDEIRRIIREEDPPKPSLRVSTLGLAAATVSDNRHCDPKALGQLFRGELDWIVMKALEKDRTRRYQTANGLATDVQRYLRDEPVLAGPPGAGYRLRKFVRRHRGLVLAAALLLFTLLAGLVGTTWGLVRAERERRDAEAARLAEADARRRETERAAAEAGQRHRAETNEQRDNDERGRAEEEKRIADAVRRFLQIDLLRQADPRTQADTLLLADGEFEAQENPTVRELLDRAAAELTADKIEAKFPKQPRVQAEILQTIGHTYLGVGEYEKAIAHLTRARDKKTRALGPDHPDTLVAARVLGEAYRRAGKTTKAIALFETVRDAQAARLGPDHPDTLATVETLAAAICRAGRPAEAVALFEAVRAARLGRLGPDHPSTLVALNNLAAAYRSAGRPAEAIALFETVRDAQAAKLGPDHPCTLGTLYNLAAAYRSAGKLDRSIPLFEEALRLRTARLGPDHPDTLATMASLGNNYRAAGREAEGVALLEEALALARKRPAPLPPPLSRVPNTLAGTYDRGGQFARSEPLYREFLEQARKQYRAGRPQVARALNRLGLNLLRQHKGAEAEPFLRECLAIREKNGPAAWMVFDTRALLGRALLGQKKYAEAEPLLRAGYEGLKERAAKIPPEHRVRVREALDALTELADARGDKDAAESWRKERAAMDP
jgi:serine/threonine protein kinase/tetratricopeptide (TPR) repeat protein